MSYKSIFFRWVFLFVLLFPRNTAFSSSIEDVSAFLVKSGDTSATLSWENPISTDHAGTMIVRGTGNFNFIPQNGKIYYFGEEATAGVVVVYYSTGNFFQDSPLKNGDKYVYQAFTFDYNVNYSNGTFQTTVYPEEDSLSPDSPTNLAGVSGNESIYLTWEESASSDVNKYFVFCEDVISQELLSRETINTDYLFEGLENDKIYDCWVTAVDYSNNESAPSNRVSILVGENNDEEAPLAIMDLSGVLENNKIVLNWTKNHDEDLAYYKVYINSSEENEVEALTEDSLYLFTDPRENTTYTFEVISIDFSGNESERSNQVEISVGEIAENLLFGSDNFVSPPKNLTGNFTDQILNLFWKGDLSSGYNVFKRCGMNNYYSKINKNLTFQTNYAVIGLVANERCEFYVKAINSKGNESAPSNIYSIIIPNNGNQIAEIRDVNILTASNQVVIDFRDSNQANLDGYNVYLNGKLLSPPSPLKNSYIALSGLEDGQNYDLKITVLDNLGNESVGKSFQINSPSSHSDNSFLESEGEASNLNSAEVLLNYNGVPEALWDLDTSNTIAGYNIYRGELINNLSRLNQGYLITELPFIDTDTVAGQKYYYQVASVGFDGLEKYRSKFVEVTSNDSANLGYFKDVVPGNPFFNYVEDLRKKQIVKGYPGHYYKPYQPITRIESLKIVMQVAEIESDSSLRFHDYYDVDKNSWGYPYIEKATFEGIIKGYTDGLFRPNQNISRVEFLKMMMNAGQIAISKSAISPFKDDKGFWGTPYIGSAYNFGIISGYSKTEFKPNNAISRAEVAKIVNALFK